MSSHRVFTARPTPAQVQRLQANASELRGLRQRNADLAQQLHAAGHEVGGGGAQTPSGFR